MREEEYTGMILMPGGEDDADLTGGEIPIEDDEEADA